MMELILDGAESVEERAQGAQHDILVEAQVLWEENYRDRYKGLGVMLDSPDLQEQMVAANTVKVIKNQEEFMKQAYKSYGEATVVSMLGDLAPKIVDAVRIAYPNSIAHILANVQTLDRMTGQILVVKPTFANTAAGVTAGDEVFANQTDGSYATTDFTDDFATGDGSTLSFSGTLASEPVVASSIDVKVAGTSVGSDDGANAITGATISTGTINYTTGAVTIVFSGGNAPTLGQEITIVYNANIETADTNYLREIDLGITIVPVTAKEHPLRLRWSEQSRFVAMSSVGIDIDDTITNVAAQFLKIEKDRTVINLIRTAAGSYNSDLAFNATLPANPLTNIGITRTDYFQDFALNISKAENAIFAASGRGNVSWLIVGTSASTVVGALRNFVKEVSNTSIGAHVVGHLDGNIPVIKDPYLPAGEFIAGFNGTIIGDTGIVIADWIPVYFTPTLVTSDLKGSKALLSMYDVVNNTDTYYVRGLISGV